MARTVLITGASTGIGAAAAQALADDGWLVYAGVRTERDALAIQSHSANIRAVTLDVTDGEAIAAAIETISAAGEPLDALINNAGIAIGGPLEYLPLDEYRRLFDINLFGAIAVTQAALPLLRKARAPRILFIGSISGHLAMPYVAPYCASKFALRATADSLRMELGPTIGVSLIEPGSVKTPIWQKGRATRDAMLQRIPDDAPPRYRRAVEAVIRNTEYEEQHGLPVERVTAAIRHALSPRAKAYYLVGALARAGSMIALLPTALKDRILQRSTKG